MKIEEFRTYEYALLYNTVFSYNTTYEKFFSISELEYFLEEQDISINSEDILAVLDRRGRNTTLLSGEVDEPFYYKADIYGTIIGTIK